MSSVEKLIKSLDALKLSSDAAAAAAAAASSDDSGAGVAVGGGSGGGVGGGIGSGVVSGLLGAAAGRNKKDAANLSRRDKVLHCNIIADSLNSSSTRCVWKIKH